MGYLNCILTVGRSALCSSTPTHMGTMTERSTCSDTNLEGFGLTVNLQPLCGPSLPDGDSPMVMPKTNVADGFIVYELLCFVCNKVDIMTHNLLVKVCVDFYGKTAIDSAKKLLHNVAPPSETLPRYRQRKGPNKKMSDISDILMCVHELGVNVPSFVAFDLPALPPLIMDCADMSALLEDIASIKSEVAWLKLERNATSELLSEIRHLRDSVKPRSSIVPPAIGSIATTNADGVAPAPTDEDYSLDDGSWPALPSAVISTAPEAGVLIPSTDLAAVVSTRSTAPAAVVSALLIAPVAGVLTLSSALVGVISSPSTTPVAVVSTTVVDVDATDPKATISTSSTAPADVDLSSSATPADVVSTALVDAVSTPSHAPIDGTVSNLICAAALTSGMNSSNSELFTTVSSNRKKRPAKNDTTNVVVIVGTGDYRSTLRAVPWVDHSHDPSVFVSRLDPCTTVKVLSSHAFNSTTLKVKCIKDTIQMIKCCS